MLHCKWKAVCAGILLLAMAPLADAAPPKPPKSGSATYSGQATVLRADVLGITTVLSDTGPLPPAGGALETSLITASVLGLVNVNVLHAATIGQGDRSRSEASVADLNLTVAGITIGAGFVMSRAMAACGGVSGSSEIAGLVINGQAIVVSG
ncbi:MAG: hypothetical protein HYX27_27960 [Acidobacteria bacterium]|nr:hypothetical protein [Acidobacteriota bacterium]